MNEVMARGEWDAIYAPIEKALGMQIEPVMLDAETKIRAAIAEHHDLAKATDLEFRLEVFVSARPGGRRFLIGGHFGSGTGQSESQEQPAA